jgi:hypothetical protein
MSGNNRMEAPAVVPCWSERPLWSATTVLEALNERQLLAQPGSAAMSAFAAGFTGIADIKRS